MTVPPHVLVAEIVSALSITGPAISSRPPSPSSRLLPSPNRITESAAINYYQRDVQDRGLDRLENVIRASRRVPLDANESSFVLQRLQFFVVLLYRLEKKLQTGFRQVYPKLCP